VIPEITTGRYLVALALTLAIEAPIVAATLKRWYRVPIARGLIVGMVASLLTHPVVWFVLPSWLAPGIGHLGYLIVAEAYAWLVEAVIYWLITRRDVVGVLLLSLLANLASFATGGLLQLVGLW
jgi:hypothetical protein